MKEEQKVAFNEYLTATNEFFFIITSVEKECLNTINTSKSKGKIAKAKKTYREIIIAKDGCSLERYINLKNDPLYKPIYERYGVDKVCEAMLNYLKL